MCAILSKKFQFLLAFLIFINILSVSLGQKEKCKDFGGYCLNQWDCCSNICMSYLYKCTRPKPTIQYQNASPITFEELMEIHFGKPTDGGNDLEEPREFQSRFGEPLRDESQLDLSAAVATTTTAPVIATEIITNTPQPEASSTVSPNSASCSEIGAKCYRHSECCSQRCHGFLHRCVT